MDEEEPPKGSSSFSILLKHCTRGEAVMLGFAAVAAFVHGASMPAIPFLFGIIVGELGNTGPNSMDNIILVTIATACLAVFIWSCSSLWFYLFSKVSVRVSTSVQRAFLVSVLGQDTEWFDKQELGTLPARLSMDVQKIEYAISARAGLIVVYMSQASCGLILGFIKSWQIALIVCACFPILAASRIYLGASSAKMSAASMQTYGQAGAHAEEVFASIRTVAAFGQESYEAERYAAYLRAGRHYVAQIAFKLGISNAVMQGALYMSYALALYVGGLLIEHGVVNSFTQAPYEGADVYVVLQSCVISALAVGNVAPPVQDFSQGMVALDGLHNTILSSESAVIETTAATIDEADEQNSAINDAPIVLQEIRLNEVSFRYPARPSVSILIRLSFSITAGQRVAFVGESGSGKSTIISLLERFYDPQNGEIFINGIDIRTLPVSKIRKIFGYVGQEPVMFATSIRNNLLYGLDYVPSDAKVGKALRMANVDSFVKSLPDGIDTFCGEGGSQMSGGQKQRLAIARALLREPQALLLDEATSALDNESEKLVQRTLDHIQSKSTLTTISIAHRLSTIRNSDVIFVFRRGGILHEQGTHDELMKIQDGMYAHLVNATDTQKAKKLISLPSASKSKFLQVSYSLIDSSLLSSLGSHASSGSSFENGVETPQTSTESYPIPFKRLFKFTVGDRWLFVPGMLGSMGTGVSFPIQALLFSLMVGYFYLTDLDEMIRSVTMVSYIYIGVAAFVCISIISSAYSFANISANFTMRMRIECFRHIMSMDIGWFDDPQHSPGNLQLSLATWAERMNVLAGPIVAVFVELIAALVSGLVIAFLGSPKLAAILLATMPFLVLGFYVAFASTSAGQSATHAIQVISQAILNIKTVRTLSAERSTLGLFDSVSAARVATESTKGFTAAFMYGMASGLLFLPYTVGFYFGGKMVYDGEIEMQQMTQVFMGLIYTGIGAAMALGFLPDVQAAKAAAHEVFELLDTPSKIDPFRPETTLQLQSQTVEYVKEGSHIAIEWGLGDGAIRFDNVFFAYPQRPETMILNGLSFFVKPGTKVALVGPSGGGKSTVMTLLLRFYDPVSGTIKIGNTNTQNMDVHGLRSLIGYVGQEPVLFNASMEDNIKYGNPSATFEDLEKMKETAKLDFIDDSALKWTTVLGPKGGILSGGQKQRAAIARALIRNPKILLFDEATSALDQPSEVVVQAAIDAAAVGRITFIIAHRLQTITDADVILVIEAGKLAESGTHEELIAKRGVYYKLFKKGM